MIAKDDVVKIAFEKGVVINEGREYHFPALPKEVLAILNDGGLIPHVKKLFGGVVERISPSGAGWKRRLNVSRLSYRGAPQPLTLSSRYA
jgi:hypothetical protein